MFHLGGFFFCIALYFLPTLIASGRHVHDRAGIVLLNIFLGWTFIGWIVALIWAITARPAYYAYPPYPPTPREW